MKKLDNNIVLTITGSDSTGESGEQADVRTITSLGGKPVSAITSVTVQNTVGIQQFYDLPASIVMGQIEAIMNDVEPSVLKIGMIRRPELVEMLAQAIVRYQPNYVVFHPVLTSSRGERLMDGDLAMRIRNQLMPLCSLIVVRRDEAGWLIQNGNDPRIVLLDEGLSLHGQANAFSSALATFLSQGSGNADAIRKANEYAARLIMKADNLQGRSQQLYNDFLNQLERHLCERTDVQFYADLLNVSSRYLSQVCRRAAGRAPKSIIDEKMAAYITMQLDSTSKTVQEIAYGAGFSSQAHLSRFFRKMSGLSPSEHRAGKK